MNFMSIWNSINRYPKLLFGASVVGLGACATGICVDFDECILVAAPLAAVFGTVFVVKLKNFLIR